MRASVSPPVSHAQRAPSVVHRLTRALDPLGAAPNRDVVQISALARALSGDDAAVNASPLPPVIAAGARFDARA